MAKGPGGQDTTPLEPETDIGEHQPSGVIKVEDEQQILKLFKSGSETSPLFSSRNNNALLNNKVNKTRVCDANDFSDFSDPNVFSVWGEIG